jgi:pimeloyl-ACP methyl ester carboxylesterase
LTAGNKLRSWFSAVGLQSPRGAEVWSAYSSLSDSETRHAFLRTLRSVVDHRGQAVSALNRLHLTSALPTMIIWGDQDRIIPVDHGYAVHEARPGSRLEVLEGVGHFPHVERPSQVVDLIDDFINAPNQATDVPRIRTDR